MSIKWNDKSLRALTVEREQYYKHPTIDGLRLRVYPTKQGCRKVWQWDRRIKGKRKPVKLGTFPDLGIVDAQDLASAANKRLALGLEPFEALKPVCTSEPVHRVTVKEAWALYAADRERVGKKFTSGKQMGEKDIVGGIGGIALVDLTSQDIERKVISRPLARARSGRKERDGRNPIKVGCTGNAVASNNLLRLTKTFLDWCVKRRLDGLVWNPAKPIEKMVTSGNREKRVLTTKEMALAIIGARMFDSERETVQRLGRRRPQTTCWSDILTLLMCLGSRKSEVLEMKKSEWDSEAKVWRLPAARYKTNRDCYLPVGAAVAAIFDRLANRNPESEWMIPAQVGVRTGNDRSVIDHITRHMEAVQGEPVDRWSMHSTRYGFRSNIRKRKLADSELAERIIHPKLKQSMDEHYDPDRFDEIRSALAGWEALLMAEVDAIIASRMRAVA